MVKSSLVSVAASAQIRAPQLQCTAASVVFGSGSQGSRKRYFSRASIQQGLGQAKPKNGSQIGKVKEKQEERDFILNVLSANTTKRDAKSYLSQFDPVHSKAPEPGKGIRQAPEQGPLHIALIKIRALETTGDEVLLGLAQTLSQLSRLGLSCVIVLDNTLDSNSHESTDMQQARQHTIEQANRFVNLLHRKTRLYANCVYSALGVVPANCYDEESSSTRDTVEVQFADMLLKPLRRGMVVVVPPIGYTTTTQKTVSVRPNDAVLALARQFGGPKIVRPTQGPAGQFQLSQEVKTASAQTSVDRIILLDPLGGLPSLSRQDHAHIFVNMEQEYRDIRKELSTEPSNLDYAAHLRNLDLLWESLAVLPSSSSAMITTPKEAAILKDDVQHDTNPHGGVRTRRPRNPLLFNLLTDKPLISSSLPAARVNPIDKESGNLKMFRSTSGGISPATFVKRGMPVTMLPDPNFAAWTPPGEAIDLINDPRIDFARLLHLIEDSFGRPLDVDDYLSRIQGRVAGVIVAGEYEGGAILTWEVPPGIDSADTTRMVPYLDKFAVLRRSQGAGGVADIVFSAMVRTCFPSGVCWRSRQNNPVNRWYFERSAGSLKLPGGQWTMFWTTPGVEVDERRFKDYTDVCAGVQPSWADRKAVPD